MIAAGLVLLLLAVTAACSGDSARKGEPTEPGQSVGEASTLEAKPVPLDIASRTIGGKLGRPRVRPVEAEIGRVVGRYLDAAYLGDYPRQDFRAAFADFADGTGAAEASDRQLLTNTAVGASLESVTATTKRVRLDMLVHRRIVAGVTAHVRLVFRQEKASGRAQRVTVTGRLLLNRDRRNSWKVFGYDVARSVVPVGKGARR